MEQLDITSPVEQNTWPPAYNLRISKKARHIHVRILQHKGLEIVVPVRQQKHFKVADLLEEKKDWILKHLKDFKAPELAHIISLNLAAISQEWRFEYKQSIMKQMRHKIRIENQINILTLFGNINDISRTQTWIKSWLIGLAKKHLLPWLRDLSIKHNLPYNAASVRAQQTLWGSCTAQKNISLNYKLLFIPEKHAEHIMLHELCHTKHLNHSKRFWDLLGKLDPEAMANDRAIRANSLTD